MGIVKQIQKSLYNKGIIKNSRGEQDTTGEKIGIKEPQRTF